jgi:tetratricopeptide (TPR) repeat protein
MLRILFFLGLLLSFQAQVYAENTSIDKALQDYQFQDFEMAKDKFEVLLKTHPDDVLVHYYLGLTYQQLQQFNLAIKHLEFAAHSDSAPEGIEKDLAELYLQANQPEKAVDYYGKAYMQNQSDGAVAMKYASALESLGETSKAKSIYQTFAISDGKFQDEALYHLGSIYSDYGAYGLAVKSFKQVSSSSAYADGASQYIEALEPTIKPISVYVSVEGFYETNPDSTSSSSLAGTSGTITKIRGSTGSTVIAKLDTAKLELNEHWRLGLGYLYYGTFYAKQFAKSNNFVGHFLNPMIHWQVSQTFSMELQADLQKFNFSQQKLSDNYGGTLTLRKKIEDGELSLALAGIEKRYNEAFNSSGTIVSLAYLNATSLSSTLSISKEVGINSLSASYAFAMERTHNNQTVILNQKASDSENIQHTISLADTIHIQDSLSLLLSGSYARKNYVNTQTGQAFASVKNAKFHVSTTVLNSTLSYAMTDKLSLDIGAEYTRNASIASEQANTDKRYFMTFSGSF